MVVTVPQVVEFEFSGTDKLLTAICEHMIENKFPEMVDSAQAGEFYVAKLLETSVKESDPEEIDLNDLIAPGL
jgi:hypothetical protein